MKSVWASNKNGKRETCMGGHTDWKDEDQREKCNSSVIINYLTV